MIDSYKYCESLYATRRKGGAYKVFARHLHLYKAVDDTFRFDRYGGTPFARIDKNNVCTFLRDLHSDDNQGKNLVQKIVRFARVHSDKGRYGLYDHTIRFRTRNANVPFTTGLAVNLVTHAITNSVPDVKKKTDRTKAKPVYQYVDKVMQMMELLLRMGSIEKTVKQGYYWRENYRMLASADGALMTLEDEHIAELAERAYREASARTNLPPKKFWGPNSTQAEVDALYREAVLKLAKRRLHAELKSRNDFCYTKEVVNNA